MSEGVLSLHVTGAGGRRQALVGTRGRQWVDRRRGRSKRVMVRANASDVSIPFCWTC